MAIQHLKDRVCIITGGAGGIGSNLCRVFGEQGAKVIVADTGFDVEGRFGMDASKVDAIVAEVRDAGGEAVPFVGDVADMDTAEAMVQTALDEFGGLDVLVCAHGILRERMIFNMMEDEWDGPRARTPQGLLRADQVRLDLLAGEPRRRASAGDLLHLRRRHPRLSGSANYSAAHAAKLGLMRSNVGALSRYGVTSNCIAPGASTRMTDRGRGVDDDAPAPSLTAAGTARDPKNVAPIVAWLASGESDDANGRIFGASGHRISLFSEPVLERYLHFDEPVSRSTSSSTSGPRRSPPAASRATKSAPVWSRPNRPPWSARCRAAIDPPAAQPHGRALPHRYRLVATDCNNVGSPIGCRFGSFDVRLPPAWPLRRAARDLMPARRRVWARRR